jgi:hypothetical protein
VLGKDISAGHPRQKRKESMMKNQQTSKPDDRELETGKMQNRDKNLDLAATNENSSTVQNQSGDTEQRLNG